MHVEFTEHLRRKEHSIIMKSCYKEDAVIDLSHLVDSFDLQKVLCCPAGKVGQIFYRRKLTSYNLTTYTRNHVIFCFMCSDIVVKRGSSEIASCLWKWMKSLKPHIKRFTLYTDSCSGQDRNIFMAAMMLSALRVLTIAVINRTFLESGHTQM